jgi:hypothetical protein
VNILGMGGEWYTMDVIRGMMQAGGNRASVFAGNGHFLGVTMLERQRSPNHTIGYQLEYPLSPTIVLDGKRSVSG